MTTDNTTNKSGFIVRVSNPKTPGWFLYFGGRERDANKSAARVFDDAIVAVDTARRACEATAKLCPPRLRGKYGSGNFVYDVESV